MEKSNVKNFSLAIAQVKNMSQYKAYIKHYNHGYILESTRSFLKPWMGFSPRNSDLICTLCAWVSGLKTTPGVIFPRAT